MSVVPLTILVVDHHRDSRFLLVKSLHRRFPHASIKEAEDGPTALRLAGGPEIAAIVTHRTPEYLGTELVEKFRAVNERAHIVMVSGAERTDRALAAGADRFVLYDEWLRVGSVVKELLEVGQRTLPARTDAVRAPSETNPGAIHVSAN